MQDFQTFLKYCVAFALFLVPVLALAWSATMFLLGPLRRIEQGMLLIELLETGLKNGRGPEEVILSAARIQERILGPRFHLLAALLEEGVPIAHAVKRAGILPRFAEEMLCIGLQSGGNLLGMIGAVRSSLLRCMDASRRSLQGPSLMFAISIPLMAATSILLMVFVLPKITQMAIDLELEPEFVRQLFGVRVRTACWAMVVAPILLWVTPFLRITNPAWSSLGLGRVSRLLDWVGFLMPWRRLRMCEDFSRSLALLLDAGLPETKAIQLAGQCAGNASFAQLACKAERMLSEGASLADAIKQVDASPEFCWRLRQGGWGPGAFQKALRGWVETLCLRAAVREEWVAQISSIALLSINGLLVALLVSSVFAFFTAVISEAASW